MLRFFKFLFGSNNVEKLDHKFHDSWGDAVRQAETRFGPSCRVVAVRALEMDEEFLINIHPNADQVVVLK